MTNILSKAERKIPVHVPELQYKQSFNVAHILGGTLSRPEQIYFSFILSFFSIFFLPSFFTRPQ
jgi:hypothetical protein